MDTTIFEDATSEYILFDKNISSLDYTESEFIKNTFKDELGNGTKVIVTYKEGNLPNLCLSFKFYEGNKNFFIFDMSLESINDKNISSNYIAPLVIRDGKFQNSSPKLTSFLEVPFDNDSWAEFTVKDLYHPGLSHEVGAFFNAKSGDGIVIGSISHDKWKSAIEYTNKIGQVDTLKVYSGANTKLTRDQSPHGSVSGKKIQSASFMFGIYTADTNWKYGLRQFGKTNVAFTPKRKSVIKTVPIGWNSWGSIQDNINHDLAVGTSEYIKDNFTDAWKDDDNTIYVNLDSFWDKLSDDELKDFVKTCENNGQKAGAYFGPLVCWMDEEGMRNNKVEGTDYTFEEIRLKKSDGSFYSNDIDGCFPLDVTHPGTVAYFTNTLTRLKDLGFKYIKLDFLVYGALEGMHYLKNIETGIEAYNYAMGIISDLLGDDIFINLSMAPTFPYNYGNGRRICCDSYGRLKETKYVLNSLSYGFFEEEIYDYIDPDHLVIWSKEGDIKEEDALSRILSGIVTGGSFLAGDNFIEPTGDKEKANERYLSLLANKELIDIAKTGGAFDAKVSDKDKYVAEVYTKVIGDKEYIVIYNFGFMPSSYTVKLDNNASKATDMISKKDVKIKDDAIKIRLKGHSSVIIEAK